MQTPDTDTDRYLTLDQAQALMAANERRLALVPPRYVVSVNRRRHTFTNLTRAVAFAVSACQPGYDTTVQQEIGPRRFKGQRLAYRPVVDVQRGPKEAGGNAAYVKVTMLSTGATRVMRG